jgi:hypothetical protein
MPREKNLAGDAKGKDAMGGGGEKLYPSSLM